jgi:hypothetical protein
MKKQLVIRILLTACAAAWLNSATPSGMAQLRNLSPYQLDRINTEHTYFVIKDENNVGFAWASEWTFMTVNTYPEKQAFFVWHFKDGSKAYSRQGENIGDAGQITGYLLTDEASSLESIEHKKIQPINRTNYPTKVELWIGEVENQTPYKPEMLVDRACFDVQSIESGRTYSCTVCRPAEKS